MLAGEPGTRSASVAGMEDSLGLGRKIPQHPALSLGGDLGESGEKATEDTDVWGSREPVLWAGEDLLHPLLPAATLPLPYHGGLPEAGW